MDAKPTYQEQLNEMRLLLGEPKSRKTLFVIVEGASDLKIIRRLLQGNPVKVSEIAGSKVDQPRLLSDLGPKHRNVACIQDADFSRLNGQSPAERLFWTDHHDMEIMMAHCDHAFNRVMYEHGEGEPTAYLQLREDLMQGLEWIGRLRWWNERHGGPLNFKGLKMSKEHFDPLKREVKRDATWTAILNRSPQFSQSTQEDPESHLKALPPHASLLQLVQGHDFCAAWATVLFQSPGKPSQNALSGEDLASLLRVAYPSSAFAETQLWADLSHWAQSLGFTLALK